MVLMNFIVFMFPCMVYCGKGGVIMEILEKEISEKAEKYICRLNETLKKECVFEQINPDTPAFGQVDIGNPCQYTIYLRKDLPQKKFELNLLHELTHAAQDSTGFPTLQVKHTVVRDFNEEHVQDLRHEVQSRILDCCVVAELADNGISSDCFIQSGFSKVIDAIQPGLNFLYPPDEIDFGMKLFYFACVSTPKNVKKLERKCERMYPGAFRKVFVLAENCKRIGFLTPEQAEKVFVECMDCYGMWDMFYYNINGVRVCSSQQAHERLETL